MLENKVMTTDTNLFIYIFQIYMYIQNMTFFKGKTVSGI